MKPQLLINMSFVTEFAIQFGLMPAPLGNGKNPASSTEDLGLVIARLLESPKYADGFNN